MKLIADTNRIMAAFLKDSISRKIIMSDKFQFLTPEHAINEIFSHKDYMCRKSKLSEQDFLVLITLIIEKIRVIPESEHKKFINEAKNLIKDPGDVPFISCALASKADGIWTEDEHFFEQNKIKAFRTKDLIEFL